MKQLLALVCGIWACVAILTACGQTPASPDGSIPQDVSTTTTTTTTEETTTTSTTEETTTTTTATTTAKPTTTMKKPTTTTTTTVKPTAVQTTATNVTTTTVTRATVSAAEEPPARKHYFHQWFDGSTVTFTYQYAEYATIHGKQKIVWVYTGKTDDGYPIVCQVDGVLESILSIRYAEERNYAESFEVADVKASYQEVLKGYDAGAMFSRIESYIDRNETDQKVTSFSVFVVRADQSEQVCYRWTFGKANGQVYVKEFSIDRDDQSEHPSYTEKPLLDYIWPEWQSSPTTAADPDAPPADRQRMSLRFAGRACTLEYDYMWVGSNGRKQWIYVERTEGYVHPFHCTVDAETGWIVSVSQNIKLSVSAVLEENEFRACFEKYYAESNLNPLYFEKAEYVNHTLLGTVGGTVTITLNDAGDKVKWTIVKWNGKAYFSSVSVVLADPNVYPDELADFYVPTYLG